MDKEKKENQKVNLSPEVKATYQYILQEFLRIEEAMRPLKEHLKWLKENGHL